jgi:hypothetical protein
MIVSPQRDQGVCWRMGENVVCRSPRSRVGLTKPAYLNFLIFTLNFGVTFSTFVTLPTAYEIFTAEANS